MSGYVVREDAPVEIDKLAVQPLEVGLPRHYTNGDAVTAWKVVRETIGGEADWYH
jgi:hypothetical protein